MSADNIAIASESVTTVSMQVDVSPVVAVGSDVLGQQQVMHMNAGTLQPQPESKSPDPHRRSVPATQVIQAEADGEIARKELNPWPHIEDFYVLESRNGQLLNFHCVLCEPKVVTINGHTSSLNNLKSHVNRNHPSHLKNFEDTVKAGSTQGKKGAPVSPVAAVSVSVSHFSPIISRSR